MPVAPAVFYRRQLLCLLAGLLLLLWLERFPALDFRLQALFFDPASGHFPLQDARWLDLLNHRLAKYLIVAAGVVLGWLGWRRRDPRQLLAVAVMLLATALVSWLKHRSAHSCPWDLQAFGGQGAWFGLFDSVPADAGPGRCFPGGHASAGFSLLALGYWLRPTRAALARQLFWLGGIAGMLMGLGQMVRGAHFLSHNLWSGWWVWLVCCALFAGYDLLWQPWRLRVAQRVPATG
ncbi:phosphatase PAP2 family protein [Vogesella oryzae]|uniref:phosphatase PAP2 family protein n=1 Tax=Vogesella oryzae TaxID=1735285 RepID=UPI001C2E9BE6|nr:phosphatase PAP2 family protein [Vogesella oryzae]